ncbi:MAG: HAMP domain-containing protein, partial [Spirochaetaceae bacterium]|nr:HAMP domain-containing protein [Spirochaetaceae bacterium]
MKIQYRLTIIVSAIVITAIAALSMVLLSRATTMQLDEARQSQDRLAAEQTRNIQIQYEGYFRIIHTLAGIMADFDDLEPGMQRSRFEPMLESTLRSNEHVVGIFVVFKSNTIDPGMDAHFIDQSGNTATGQWASWYTRRTGVIEHLVYENVPEIMASIAANIRTATIDEPQPLTVMGTSTHLLKITVPVIHRQTNEIVGRIGINVDTKYIQPLVTAILNNNAEIDAISIYSANTTIIASPNVEQVGLPLKEGQKALYGTFADQAHDAVVQAKSFRFTGYSRILDETLAIILYPFSIGDTGVYWALMLGTNRDMILSDIRAMTIFAVSIALGVLLISMILVYAAAQTISKPIIKVALTLKDISGDEGDLTRVVEISSKDEIGDLARYFNATLEKIRDLVMVIKEQSACLFTIGS